MLLTMEGEGQEGKKEKIFLLDYLSWFQHCTGFLYQEALVG